MNLRLSILLVALFALSMSAFATRVTVTASASPNSFNPSTATAHQGDTIVWNATSGFHNVSSNQPGLFGNTPASAPWTYLWPIPVDQTPGNYGYVCEVHAPGMAGTIVVQAASAVEENPAVTAGFKLEQNYPNPFNSQTEISFEVPYESKIKLTLFNVIGNEVSELASGVYSIGSHKILLDAVDYSTGLYYYQLETPVGILTRSMMYVK